MIPALPLDEETGSFFKELARLSGVTFPAWCRASLAADCSRGTVNLIIEVPVAKSALEAAAVALEQQA